MNRDVLTIREVASYLKVNEKTVYGLAQKHRIPGFKVGGQWRFRRADLDSWIAARPNPVVPENRRATSIGRRARPGSPKSGSQR